MDTEEVMNYYEARIKQIVKEAMAKGYFWTDKEFGQINAEARAEVSAETAAKIFGGKS
jgi:hypothetical protein